MLESIDSVLTKFEISHYGFLPVEEPLRYLPDQYFEPWESLIKLLPQLISEGTLYDEFAKLSVLTTERLKTIPEWRRAYVILAFFAHAHIWAAKQPCDKLPPNITLPLLAVAEHLELPPTATYPGLNLWNCGLIREGADITNPENVVMRHTFTGTSDEEWFYAVSVSVEARGVRAIEIMLECVQAVEKSDDAKISDCLVELTSVITQLGKTLHRMHERCKPDVFYNRIRPFLAGSRGMEKVGLPHGVFYDEGKGVGSWRQFSGGSNAQSTLIQFLDIALGVKHEATGTGAAAVTTRKATYLDEMRKYMPIAHRRFLEHFSKIVNVQPYALRADVSENVRSAFEAAVEAMTQFRDIHIQIVARYIVAPSRMAKSVSLAGVKNIASASADSSGSRDELKGTGGTDLMGFLKQTRDETRAARSVSRATA